MEGFSAERKPEKESGGEVPPEILAANDEFFSLFLSDEVLAMRGLGQEFIKQKFALETVRKNIQKDPHSLFINSLKFTEEDIAVECERIADAMREIGRKGNKEAKVEEYFLEIDSLVKKGDRRTEKRVE